MQLKSLAGAALVVAFCVSPVLAQNNPIIINWQGSQGTVLSEGTKISPYNSGNTCEGVPSNALLWSAYPISFDLGGGLVASAGQSYSVGISQIPMVGGNDCSAGADPNQVPFIKANGSGGSGVKAVWQGAKGWRAQYRAVFSSTSTSYIEKDTAVFVPTSEGMIRIIYLDAATGGPINRPPWAEQATYELYNPNGKAWGWFPTGYAQTVDYRLPSGDSCVFHPTGINGGNYSVHLPVPFPGQNTINIYRIYLNQSNSTYTFTPDPGNVVPVDTTPTPTPTPSGGTYTGPPGESNWWVDMLVAAFVPSQTTLSAWQGFYNQLRGWGPFGWVYAVLASPTPIDGPNANTNLIYRWQIAGVDMCWDFRAGPNPELSQTPYASAGVPRTRGTMYGTLRAWLRVASGASVYVLSALGLYRWLRPRLSF